MTRGRAGNEIDRTNFNRDLRVDDTRGKDPPEAKGDDASCFHAGIFAHTPRRGER